MGKKHKGNKGKGGGGGGTASTTVITAVNSPTPQPPVSECKPSPEVDSKTATDQQLASPIEVEPQGGIIASTSQVQQTQLNAKIDKNKNNSTEEKNPPGDCTGTGLKIETAAEKTSECQDEERSLPLSGEQQQQQLQLPKDAVQAAVPNNAMTGTGTGKRNKNKNNKTKNAAAIGTTLPPSGETTVQETKKSEEKVNTSDPITAVEDLKIDGTQTLSNRQKKKLKKLQDEERAKKESSEETGEDLKGVEIRKQEGPEEIVVDNQTESKTAEVIVTEDVEKEREKEKTTPKKEDFLKQKPEDKKQDISSNKSNKKQKGKGNNKSIIEDPPPPSEPISGKKESHNEALKEAKKVPEMVKAEVVELVVKETQPLPSEGSKNDNSAEVLPTLKDIEKDELSKEDDKTSVIEELERPKNTESQKSVKSSSEVNKNNQHDKKAVKKGHCPYEHPKEHCPKNGKKEIAPEIEVLKSECVKEKMDDKKGPSGDDVSKKEREDEKPVNLMSQERNVSKKAPPASPDIQPKETIRQEDPIPKESLSEPKAKTHQGGNKKQEKQKKTSPVPVQKKESPIKIIPPAIIEEPEPVKPDKTANLFDSVCLVESPTKESNLVQSQSSSTKDDQLMELSDSFEPLKMENLSLESMTDSTTTDITVVVEKSLENISNVPDDEIMKLFNIVSKEFEKSPEPKATPPKMSSFQEPIQQAGEALANLIDVVGKTESKIKESVEETRNKQQMKANKSKKSKSKTPEKTSQQNSGKKDKDLLKDVIVVETKDCDTLPEEPGDPPVGDPPLKKSQSPESAERSKKSSSRKSSTDSKNGQRSDFVLSVEDQQDGAKSLLKTESIPVAQGEKEKEEEKEEMKEEKKEVEAVIKAVPIGETKKEGDADNLVKDIPKKDIREKTIKPVEGQSEQLIICAAETVVKEDLPRSDEITKGKQNENKDKKAVDLKTKKQLPANSKPVSLDMILKPNLNKEGHIEPVKDLTSSPAPVEKESQKLLPITKEDNKLIEEKKVAEVELNQEKPLIVTPAKAKQDPLVNNQQNKDQAISKSCSPLKDVKVAMEIDKKDDQVEPPSSLTESTTTPPKTDSPIQPEKLLAPSSNKNNNKKSKSKSPEIKPNNQSPTAIVVNGSVDHRPGNPVVPPRPEHTKNKPVKQPTKPSPQKSITKSKPPPPLLIPSEDDDEDEDEEEYVEYKFSPRKVFLANICHTCQSVLNAKAFLCPHCKMIAYCGPKHCQEDEANHRDYCVAIQEVAKKRGGHVYQNCKVLSPNDFRNLRVHTLNICSAALKRPLQAFEKEILLFPRLCVQTECRNWKAEELESCPKCHQVAFCKASPGHLGESHQKWCAIFTMYQLLVLKTSKLGRIEPAMPSAIFAQSMDLPKTMDELFKMLYGGPVRDPCLKVVLSQLATGPLTALNAARIANVKIGESFVIHLIGAELQFEGDTLDKWEAFFLHLVPGLTELRIVFVGPELNVENLPVEILSRIRMCRFCRKACRNVRFDFQSRLYHEYVKSTSFIKPDLVCYFNPGLYRMTGFSGLDTWPDTIQSSLRFNCPVVVTSYTEFESPLDMAQIQKMGAEMLGKTTLEVLQPPAVNPFASQRPERNFISDDVAPMIFKNYFHFVVK